MNIIEKLKELEKKNVTIGIHGEQGEQKKLVRKVDHGTKVKNGQKRFEVSKNITVAQVASWNEFGTKRIPERSFIRQSLLKNRLTIRKKFVELLNNNIDNCLDLMGIYMTNLIKERMAQGIKPNNSKITIQRKGSSTPLIDSGQLRNSITHRVNND